MLVVVLHYADGEVMQFGPFATFSEALCFVVYMSQLETLAGVEVVRNHG